MKRFAFLLSLIIILTPGIAASKDVTFKDKQITMIVGFAPGGGTDLAGRVIARFLSQYLPGQPVIIVRNQPGADGISALNLMLHQTKPDGLSIAMGSSSQVDPLNYRTAKAIYDPSKFAYIGGVGRGRSYVVANANSENRLLDKSASPLMMGSIGVPRSGMQVTAWGIEYLGWNAKWILGYRGTNDVILALSRGEIDMTSVNMAQTLKLTADGKFKAITQAGNLESQESVTPEIAQVPIFKQEIQSKLVNSTAQQAFSYWSSLNSVDKWMALMPDTPADIIASYRKAFRNAMSDPEFIKQGRAASEDFTPISYKITEAIVRTLVATPQEAIGYTSSLLRKQGIDVSE